MPGERARRSAWRAIALALALAALAAVAAPARAADELPEYRLKAAFLYNFAVFTEWPASAGQALQLCVIGADPFGADLDALQGRAVGARSLAVQRRAAGDMGRGCQVVFLPRTAAAQLPRVAEALRGTPVLVVAEAAGALQDGAMVNLNVAGGRVTFEVHLDAARKAGLGLSARLLKLATEVIQ